MAQTFDIILLLAGETDSYFRSKEALGHLERAGGIFVTGGWGGFDRKLSYVYDGGSATKSYLRSYMPNKKSVFLDTQSRETLGNFAFPAARPIQGNPSLAKDFKRILLVTDEAHMQRAEFWANKILPRSVYVECAVSRGPKEQGAITRIYDLTLANKLRKVPDHEPEAFVEFLEKEHLFYSKQWYDKPVKQRQVELALKCMKWYFA